MNALSLQHCRDHITGMLYMTTCNNKPNIIISMHTKLQYYGHMQCFIELLSLVYGINILFHRKYAYFTVFCYCNCF